MRKNKNAFTLIDVLIGTALLLIVVIGLYGLFQFSLKIVSQSKARITAVALANQKLEIIKNLSYSDAGTLGGIPAGNIPETEIISRNNIEYTVKTTISYIDDPFDGVAPIDTIPNDYKRIKIKTSWSGFLGGEITSNSDITPKGLETTEGGGNLLISVFDALGVPIEQANIYIVNNSVIPTINTNYQTNNQGQYLVAGASSSTIAYQITASKTGYSQHRTYDTSEVANPEKPHTTVLEGMMTEISFSIDWLSSFNVQILSIWNTPIPDVSLNLQGHKIIGTDAEENPVYKYSQDFTTNSEGQVNISDLEWDLYDFTISPSENLDIASTSPVSTPAGIDINLLPDATNQTIILYLEAENSLLITTQDSEASSPIFNSQVRIYNTGIAYDNTSFTDASGRVVFIPLESANYNIEIEVDGYADYIGSTNVNGDEAIIINLIANEPS